MFKKCLLLAAIIMTLASFTVCPYAAPTVTRIRAEGGLVFDLQKNMDGTKTFEKDQIISGKAKEGTVISLSHYWFKKNDDKSIVTKKKPSDGSKAPETGEWVLVGTDEWTVGASGIFARPVTLIVGKNRLVLKVKDKAGNKKTVTIDMELVDKSQLTEYMNNIILKDVEIN